MRVAGLVLPHARVNYCSNLLWFSLMNQQLWLSSQGDIALLLSLKFEPAVPYPVKVARELPLQVRSSEYTWQYVLLAVCVNSLVQSGRRDEFPSV